jgi:hypothetical protein
MGISSVLLVLDFVKLEVTEGAEATEKSFHHRDAEKTENSSFMISNKKISVISVSLW